MGTHANLLIELTRERVGAAGYAGISTHTDVSGGTLHLGAGARAAISVRHQRAPQVGEGRSAQADRIHAEEAYKLGNEIFRRSGGSYDLADVPFVEMLDMIERYPALVKPEHYPQIAKYHEKFQRYHGDVLEALDFLKRDTLYKEYPELEPYRDKLTRPLTIKGYNSLTLNDVRGATREWLGKLKEFNTETGFLTEPRSAAQDAKIDQWFADHGLKRPLTPDEKTEFLKGLRSTKEELERFPNLFSSLPTAKEVKEAHDKVSKIVKFDVRAEVTGQVGAAYETKPFSGRTSVVVGGLLERGWSFSPADIAAVRLGNGDVDIKLTPAQIGRTMLSVGVGRDASVAMPPEMAMALGLVPMRGDLGGYIALKNQNEKSDGGLVFKTSEIAAAIVYAISPSSYATLGVSKQGGLPKRVDIAGGVRF